jgi:hypothetical protein
MYLWRQPLQKESSSNKDRQNFRKTIRVSPPNHIICQGVIKGPVTEGGQEKDVDDDEKNKVH